MAKSAIQPGEYDEKKMFEAGLQFECAAILLSSAVEERKQLHGSIPGVVYALNGNGALASELYFKCALLVNNMEAPRVHDLSELLAATKEPLRGQLIKSYSNLFYYGKPLFTCPFVPEGIFGQKHSPSRDDFWKTARRNPNDYPEENDFVLACEKSRYAFVQSRYFFEGTASQDSVIPNIVTTLRKAVVSKKPEWDGLVQEYLLTIGLARLSPGLREASEKSRQA